MNKQEIQAELKKVSGYIHANEIPKEAVFRILQGSRFINKTGVIEPYYSFIVYYKINKRFFFKWKEVEVVKYVRVGLDQLEFHSERKAKEWVRNFRKFNNRNSIPVIK